MKKSLLTIFILSLCTGFICSCNNAENKSESPVVAAPADLNSVVTNLPEAPGYKTFQGNCISCHSARFVQMQPNLSEKAWSAIVNKMQKSFGAPIPDSSIAPIVEYLVAIKGKS
ncbi:MAG: cytochrome c [Ginsengibacter sp.]